jgi:hypothetical protein
VLAATGDVVMVKVALVAPAVMVTLAGTCATDVLLLDSVTIAPPVGAFPFSVTVPVELLPPTTEVGDRVIEDNDAAVTVSVAFALVPSVAVMLAVVVAETASVVTVKVAEVFPAVTVTFAGTVAAAVLPLASDTEIPPVGAAPLRVTVPVALFPPTTLVGFSVTLDTDGGFMVRVAFALPPRVAVTVAVATAATGWVVTVNVAEVLPAGTVTLLGTVAADVLLLERVTAAPPIGAAPLSVTVPVEDDPPVTVLGFNDTADTVTLLVTGVTVSVAVRVVPVG